MGCHSNEWLRHFCQINNQGILKNKTEIIPHNYYTNYIKNNYICHISQILIKDLNISNDTKKIKEYHKIVGPTFEIILKNQQEIHHLTTLRDTLLPKLMSGEIDVNEVEI